MRRAYGGGKEGAIERAWGVETERRGSVRSVKVRRKLRAFILKFEGI
jgi:hypothetical protein